MHSWRSTYLLVKQQQQHQQQDDEQEQQAVLLHEGCESHARSHSGFTSPASQAETSPYPFLTRPRSSTTVAAALFSSPQSSSFSPASSSSWRGSPFVTTTTMTKAGAKTTTPALVPASPLHHPCALQLTPPRALEDVPMLDFYAMPQPSGSGNSHAVGDTQFDAELNKTLVEHVLTIDGNSEESTSTRTTSTTTAAMVAVDEGDEAAREDSASSDVTLLLLQTTNNDMHAATSEITSDDAPHDSAALVGQQPHNVATTAPLSLPPRVPHLCALPRQSPQEARGGGEGKTGAASSAAGLRVMGSGASREEENDEERMNGARAASPSSPSVTVSSASAPSPSSLRLTRSPSPSPPRRRRAVQRRRSASSQRVSQPSTATTTVSRSSSHKTPSPSPSHLQQQEEQGCGSPTLAEPALSSSSSPLPPCAPAFLSLTPYLHRTQCLGSVRIELAPGRCEEVAIYRNDAAEALADRFMRDHGLSGDEAYLVLFDFLHTQIAALRRRASTETRRASTAPRPAMARASQAGNNITGATSGVRSGAVANTVLRKPRATASTCVKPPAPTRALLLRQQAAAARLAMHIDPHDTLQRGLVHCRRRNGAPRAGLSEPPSAARTTSTARAAVHTQTAPLPAAMPSPRETPASPPHSTPTRRLFAHAAEASTSSRRSQVRKGISLTDVPGLPDNLVFHCTPYRGR